MLQNIMWTLGYVPMRAAMTLLALVGGLGLMCVVLLLIIVAMIASRSKKAKAPKRIREAEANDVEAA